MIARARLGWLGRFARCQQLARSCGSTTHTRRSPAGGKAAMPSLPLRYEQGVILGGITQPLLARCLFRQRRDRRNLTVGHHNRRALLSCPHEICGAGLRFWPAASGDARSRLCARVDGLPSLPLPSLRSSTGKWPAALARSVRWLVGLVAAVKDWRELVGPEVSAKVDAIDKIESAVNNGPITGSRAD